jgi:hypothetical protein
MTGSGLPHEPPSFINPRIPLDAHGIANHPTQRAFLAGSVKAIDATMPSLGGDNIPRAIKKNSTRCLKRRASRKPEHPRFYKTDFDDAFKREQEERKEAKRPARDREAMKRTRRLGFLAMTSAAFGVLINAFVVSSKKRKREKS